MKLIEHWQRVLCRAWSIRLIIMAGVLTGAEVALPLINGVIDIPRGVFAAASAVASAGAFIARLVAQQEVSDVD